MSDIDIRKLATLARVAVSDEEVVKLKKEVPAILDFVAQIAQVGGKEEQNIGELYNVFRKDENPHKSGLYTQKILDAMPHHTNDGYLKVRKIIPQD